MRQKYKGRKPKDKMRIIANNIRKNLTYDHYIFPLDRIDLATSTDNGTNYMSAHICGKYYSLSNLPSNTQLAKDLQEMIMLYSQLKTIIAGRMVEKMLDFYLQKEEIEDLQFQNDILVAPTAHTPRKPQHIPYISSSIERQIWRRNASIAREALQEAHYLCEINNKHLTFKSNITNENFVEAHHLIPIKFQNYFSWSLDVPGNIVSLCPNCHRKIHHANKKERKIILKFLYKKYKNALSDYDILVPLDNIYKFYEC
ncbi:DUF3578 domain-containing protein [Priestia megaterium]|nr:DUF3578 domain-containing protein [Priestia megaterium]PFA93640.1 DUF3578 domain-containing protein [Priestia megaterium]